MTLFATPKTHHGLPGSILTMTCTTTRVIAWTMGTPEPTQSVGVSRPTTSIKRLTFCSLPGMAVLFLPPAMSFLLLLVLLALLLVVLVIRHLWWLCVHRSIRFLSYYPFASYMSCSSSPVLKRLPGLACLTLCTISLDLTHLVIVHPYVILVRYPFPDPHGCL